MTTPRSPDIQILGGGVLGVLIALLAAQRGFRVVVYRLSDRHAPNADSLRNHSWLQSGLLYARTLVREIAMRMGYSGRALHELFAMPLPSSRGVFRVGNDDAAELLIEDARSIGISSKVERIHEKDLTTLLGPFHVPGQPCFWVPDTPFDEAGIMAAARDEARHLGVTFYDLDEDARIERDSSTPAGVLVLVEGQRIESPIVVLAAGAQTTTLLDSIGLQRSIVVNQSPLLVVDDSNFLSVPLLADLSNDLAVVRHDQRAFPPGGRLVIGNRHRRVVRPEEPRDLDDEACKSILKLLPATVLKHLEEVPYRYTAGRKTEFFTDEGKLSVVPWLEAFEYAPGLIAAIPGKATMAFWTAEEVIDLATDRLTRITASSSTRPMSPLRARIWDGSVDPHHAKSFDRMDDSKNARH